LRRLSHRRARPTPSSTCRLARARISISNLQQRCFTLPAIGGNLIGLLNFEDYKTRLAERRPGDFHCLGRSLRFSGQEFFLDSEGPALRPACGWCRDGQTFGFVQDDYRWTSLTAEGVRGVQSAGLFTIPANAGFDPSKPWAAGTFGQWRRCPAGHGCVRARLPGPRRVCPRRAFDDALGSSVAPPLSSSIKTSVGRGQGASGFQLPPESEPPPISGLCRGLARQPRQRCDSCGAPTTVLTLIFIFQSALARFRARAHRLVRNGFLAVVLGPGSAGPPACNCRSSMSSTM